MIASSLPRALQHLAVERKKIARFTHRADYVHLLCLTLTWRFASSSP